MAGTCIILIIQPDTLIFIHFAASLNNLVLFNSKLVNAAVFPVHKTNGLPNTRHCKADNEKKILIGGNGLQFVEEWLD